MANAVVILNAKAGTLQDRTGIDIEARVRQAVAGSGFNAEVVLAADGDFFEAITRAAKHGPKTLIVGGGDGSVSHAVRNLAGTGKTLGVLPLGTMNLFARSLGMPAGLDAALAAFAEVEPVAIDLGSINGTIFHTLVGLGFFAEVARGRAQVRGNSALPFGRFIAVARSSLRAFLRTGTMQLTVEAAGVRRDLAAYALFASNNRLSPTGFDRPRLDEGVIEIHVAEGAEMARRMQHGLDFIAGRWRDNDEITTITAAQATVLTHRPRLWVSIDGELVRVQAPLKLESLPKALSVLMPKRRSPGTISG